MKTFMLLIVAAWLPFALFSQSINTTIPNTDGSVSALVINGNDIYIAGTFSMVGSTARNYLAKINATTGAVQAWNPDVNSFVNCMALSADGSTLFIGGSFTSVNSTSRNYLAAVNTTTGALTTWNPSPDFILEYMVCAPDNTVYFTGPFSTVKNADGSTVSRNGMAAVNVAGDATNFNPRANNTAQIRDLALSSDNNFLFVGIGNGSINFTDDMFNMVNRQAFAALNVSDGTPTAWDAHPSNGVFDIEVSGTTLYMAGSFTTVNNGADNRSHVAKWTNVNTSPTLDASFDPPSMSNVRTIALNGSQLHCLGSSNKIGTDLRARFFTLNTTSGAAETNLNMGANDYSDGTSTKFLGNFANNRLYLSGTSGQRSFLGEAGRYFQCINLMGNAIAAKSFREIPDAMGTVSYPLNAPQNSAMILDITDASSGSSPYIFADRYTTAPQNVSGVAEANVLPYRFMFQNIGVSGTTRTLKFKLSDIPNNGLLTPANTKIYYRNTPGEGVFTSAGTVTYNAGTGTLSIDHGSWFGANEIIFATNDMVVLPVELMGFKGQNTEGGNLLTWQTAQELNTLCFDIERSIDNRQFEKIGVLKTNGSNSNYQFLDIETTNSIAYYRLKINDFDGKFDYSKVIALQSKDKTQVEVYPSVTTGEVKIVGAKFFQVFNLAGQVVFEKKGMVAGTSFIYLNEQPSGTYIVKGVDTEGVAFSQKIMKE